jgi:tripartite-type tricarboxylate transporter receptor subunit TctC
MPSRLWFPDPSWTSFFAGLSLAVYLMLLWRVLAKSRPRAAHRAICSFCRWSARRICHHGDALSWHFCDIAIGADVRSSRKSRPKSLGFLECRSKQLIYGFTAAQSTERAMMSKGRLVALLALVCFGTTAAAQSWPDRPLTLVVPFAAGGGIDATARVQALALSEVLGQSVIVENIGAAGGTVGSARVAKSAPDGYTFLIGNSGTHAYSQSLYKKRPYDAAADFEPIALVSESPRILIVRKDLPVGNLQDFVAYTKANQGKMQYGSAGVGSGTHLPCALLNIALGVDIVHVPYRGAGNAMQDLLGGRIDYMCDTIQTGVEQVRSGTVKGIAVMAPRRVPIIADLATTSEQGLAGVEASVWNVSSFPRERRKPSCVRCTRRSAS